MRRYKEAYVISFDGTEIYYETMGEGVPVVLADGIGCIGYVWKYITSYFKPILRFVHWHYRGHGRSQTPKDLENLSIRDNCRDLLAVMDTEGIDKAIIMGHSMGCQVLLEFYRMYPDRVMGLVPICGSYGRPLTTFHDSDTLARIFPILYAMVMLDFGPVELFWRTVAPSPVAMFIAKNFEVNGKMIRDEDFWPYFKYLGGQQDIRVFFKMLWHAARHTAEDMLSQICVPTLIVAGERDTFTPMWISQRMHERIPGSELCVIPKGSHTAPIEMPELINLRLERWLKKNFGLPYPSELAAKQKRRTAKRGRAKAKRSA